MAAIRINETFTASEDPQEVVAATGGRSVSVTRLRVEVQQDPATTYTFSWTNDEEDEVVIYGPYSKDSVEAYWPGICITGPGAPLNITVTGGSITMDLQYMEV